MNNLPVGPIILPITKASKPVWEPKFRILNPGFTICPIKLIKWISQVPVLSITLETEPSTGSTYILNPWMVWTNFILLLFGVGLGTFCKGILTYRPHVTTSELLLFPLWIKSIFVFSFNGVGFDELTLTFELTASAVLFLKIFLFDDTSIVFTFSPLKLVFSPILIYSTLFGSTLFN